MNKIASLIVLGALAALQASAVPINTDLGSAVKNLLTKMQQWMACNFVDGESYGITLNDDDKRNTFQYNAPDLGLNIKFENIMLNLPNSFEVLSSKYNKNTKEYGIVLNFNKIPVYFEYENVTYEKTMLKSKSILELELQETQVIVNIKFGQDSTGNLNIVGKDVNIAMSQSETDPKYKYDEEELDNALIEIQKFFKEMLNDYVSKLNEGFSEAFLESNSLKELVKDLKSVDELTEKIIEITDDEDNWSCENLN